MGPTSLLVLLLLPLTGAILIALLPARPASVFRFLALLFTTITFLFAAWLLPGGELTVTASGLWQSYHHAWHTRLGTSFSLGVDGFSYPMILLATLLSWVAVLASGGIERQTRGYYLLMLLLEAAMLGVFMARDWALFYVFWELTLIPLFFLIDRWGGKDRQSASLNFVLYTMGGSVFMLLSLLVLFDATPGHSFSFDHIAEGAKLLGRDQQILIFLGLLIGFGVKMPVFPLHGWLPIAHVEAPSPVSILLSGILLKMGAYGLIRSTGMLPHAAEAMQTILLALALIGIIYGGLLAWRQVDLKKMIAYSSVAHMGVVLLGIATLNVNGMTGAVYQMVAHGLVAGALFMLIGLLYERTHTRDVTDYGSLLHTTPKFAFFLVIAVIAGVGFPGTAGFIAELHALLGGFEAWGWPVALLSLGVLISVVYGVRTVKHLFTGPARSRMADIKDLRPMEMFAAVVLTAGILLLGFWPAPLLQLIGPTIHAFQHLLTGA